MNRGFITIATGKEHYYRLAANLLQSYRYYSPHPLPFAILAEEENQYTAQFDDVIIINDSTHSFMDKLLLLKYCPYDETIFVDADCLTYGDLNHFWDIFQNATDFSAIGINVPRDQAEGAWYNIEDIGEYGKKLEYKSRVHTGVCFIRKSEKLQKLYDDSIDISEHFSELHFHTCPDAKEECILGISMPMNGMKAVRSGDMLVTYPLATFLNADILHGRLQFKTDWQDFVDSGLLLHWGTAQTFTPLYLFQEACLHHLIARGDRSPNVAEKIWYEKKLLLGYLMLKAQFRRAVKYIKRLVNRLTGARDRKRI